jgi:hypothetical protein
MEIVDDAVKLPEGLTDDFHNRVGFEKGVASLLDTLPGCVDSRKLAKHFVSARQLNHYLNRSRYRSKHNLSTQWRYLAIKREDRAEARRVEDARVGEVQNKILYTISDLFLSRILKFRCIAEVKSLPDSDNCRVNGDRLYDKIHCGYLHGRL